MTEQQTPDREKKIAEIRDALDKEQEIKKIRDVVEHRRSHSYYEMVYNENHEKYIRFLLDELERVNREWDKLIEGLRWYADEDTHMIKRRVLGDFAPISLDKGQRARDILKKIGVMVE